MEKPVQASEPFHRVIARREAYGTKIGVPLHRYLESSDEPNLTKNRLALGRALWRAQTSGDEREGARAVAAILEVIKFKASSIREEILDRDAIP